MTLDDLLSGNFVKNFIMLTFLKVFKRSGVKLILYRRKRRFWNFKMTLFDL